MRWMFAAGALVLGALMCAPESRAQDSDSLTWARANTCERIQAYITQFPNGRYLAEARRQLTARNCDGARAASRQATAPPADPCVQARADWSALSTSTDVLALEAYTRAIPQRCAVQLTLANDRLQTLRQQSSRAQLEQEINAALAALWGQSQFPGEPRTCTGIRYHLDGDTFRRTLPLHSPPPDPPETIWAYHVTQIIRKDGGFEINYDSITYTRGSDTSVLAHSGKIVIFFSYHQALARGVDDHPSDGRYVDAQLRC